MQQPKKSAIRRNAVVAVIVIVLIVAGVGVYLQFLKKPAATSVTLGIDVAPQGTHALFYAGVAEGFYNRSGLNVHFIFNRGATAVVQGVDSGRFDFGYTDLGTITVLDSQGAHVKAIGAIQKKNQIATFYLPNSGISTPKDLEGKVLADNAGSSTHVFFPAFAKLAGFNASRVQFVNVDFSARNGMLLSGRAQAIGGFTGTVLPAFGSKVKYFLWADYGFNAYSNGLLTSDSMIQQHPEIVSRFVEASYQAFVWTSQNQQGAVRDLLKYHPELNATQAGVGLSVQLATMGNMNASPAKNIGVFDAALVASTIKITCEYLKCASTVSPSQVYTNQFVQ